MNLVLIGLRGTGKSTVGRMLSDQLGWQFFDTDSLVQERAGKTIREIFEQAGEAGFRILEAEIVREVSAHDRAVIATGGGSVLNPDNVIALKHNSFVIHLTADPVELWRRICGDGSSHAQRPPLTRDAHSGIDELKQLLLSRAAIYEHARDVEVSVENRLPDEVAEAVLMMLRAHGVQL